MFPKILESCTSMIGLDESSVLGDQIIPATIPCWPVGQVVVSQLCSGCGTYGTINFYRIIVEQSDHHIRLFQMSRCMMSLCLDNLILSAIIPEFLNQPYGLPYGFASKLGTLRIQPTISHDIHPLILVTEYMLCVYIYIFVYIKSYSLISHH